MELNHSALNAAGPAKEDGTVPFDVLRTMISARQAATPTVRLQSVDQSAKPAASFGALFATNGVGLASLRDQMVPTQDERHG